MRGVRARGACEGGVRGVRARGACEGCALLRRRGVQPGVGPTARAPTRWCRFDHVQTTSLLPALGRQSYTNPHSALRTPQSAIRNPHSALRTPQSALRTPQGWTLRKRVERFVKVWLCRLDGAGISCLPPAAYARRFRERVVEVIFDAPLSPLMEAILMGSPQPNALVE